MKNRKSLYTILIILLFSGGFLIRQTFSDTSSERNVLYTQVAKRETFRLVVRETGMLRPRDAEVIPGAVSGKVMWIADEGTRVKKGDKVAVIDDEGSRDWVVSFQFDYKASSCTLHKALLDYGLLEKTLSYDRRLAEVDVRRAELKLKTLKEAPTAKDLTCAKLKCEQSELKEKAAKKEYERRATFLEMGIASANEVSKAQLAYRKAQAAREQAEVEFELTRKGLPVEDIQIAEQKVRQAIIKLQEIDKTTSAQLALKRSAVAVAQAQTDQTSESLSRFTRRMINATHLAPADGTVLYNLQWGRPEEGKRVWGGDPFIDIVNLSRMVVETRINEVDIRSIGVGQKVLVRLESFPDKEFHGKVARIAGLAVDRSEGMQSANNREMSGVMIFDVSIEIDEADPALRPTMTANLEIITDEIKDAISIPCCAVIERGGKQIVYVKEGSDIVPRTVKTGKVGNSCVVIESGIKEGDVVCVMRKNI